MRTGMGFQMALEQQPSRCRTVTVTVAAPVPSLRRLPAAAEVTSHESEAQVPSQCVGRVVLSGLDPFARERGRVRLSRLPASAAEAAPPVTVSEHPGRDRRQPREDGSTETRLRMVA